MHENQRAGRGRGSVFVFGQLIEGGIPPAFAAEFSQRNADRNFMYPCSKETAAFKCAQLVEHAQSF